MRKMLFSLTPYANVITFFVTYKIMWKPLKPPHYCENNQQTPLIIVGNL